MLLVLRNLTALTTLRLDFIQLILDIFNHYVSLFLGHVRWFSHHLRRVLSRLNSLFEKEIGIEDPEVYNQKERKPGVHKERYMYGNPMRDRSMLNQLGILKKSTVIGNNSHVVAQLESQNS